MRSGGLSGDEAYLVAHYEFTPGFDEIEAMSVGGQAHYWIARCRETRSDIQRQRTGYGTDSSMHAVDATVKLAPDTWIKLQQARSEGLVSLPVRSNDGGFQFNSVDGRHSSMPRRRRAERT